MVFLLPSLVGLIPFQAHGGDDCAGVGDGVFQDADDDAVLGGAYLLQHVAHVVLDQGDQRAALEDGAWLDLGEDQAADPYVALIKRLAVNDKVDFEAAKLLIQEYKRQKEDP